MGKYFFLPLFFLCTNGQIDCSQAGVNAKMAKNENLVSYHLAQPVFSIQKLTHREMLDKDVMKNFQGVITFEVGGLAPGEEFELYNVNVSNGHVLMDTYKVDDEGSLRSLTNPKLKLSKHQIVLNGFMPGEPTGYVLVSKDARVLLKDAITPCPIECSWKDGASVKAIMISGDAMNFSIFGKGFKPEEKIAFRSISANEVLPWEIDVSADGTFGFAVSPAVIGRSGGINNLYMTRKETKEKASLTIPWGSAAKKTLVK